VRGAASEGADSAWSDGVGHAEGGATTIGGGGPNGAGVRTHPKSMASNNTPRHARPTASKPAEGRGSTAAGLFDRAARDKMIAIPASMGSPMARPTITTLIQLHSNTDELMVLLRTCD
jgi:hypothetical protein